MVTHKSRFKITFKVEFIVSVNVNCDSQRVIYRYSFLSTIGTYISPWHAVIEISKENEVIETIQD